MARVNHTCSNTTVTNISWKQGLGTFGAIPLTSEQLNVVVGFLVGGDFFKNAHAGCLEFLLLFFWFILFLHLSGQSVNDKIIILCVG